MAEPGYLYFLKAVNSNSTYFGSTKNLCDRLKRHNADRNKATCGRGPWKYTAILEFESPKAARKAEQLLKRMHRKDLVEAVINGSFQWKKNTGVVGYVDTDTIA